MYYITLTHQFQLSAERTGRTRVPWQRSGRFCGHAIYCPDFLVFVYFPAVRLTKAEGLTENRYFYPPYASGFLSAEIRNTHTVSIGLLLQFRLYCR